MIKRLVLIFVTAFCLSTVSQVLGEVLEGPRGPVEFIGLEKWTASELFDAIKATDPDKPFHACAAVMIKDLEFPDAAAFGTFTTREDGSQELYTVIVGVENGSLVRYGTAGKESLELPESWLELHARVEESFHTHLAAVQVHYMLAQPETAKQFAELSEEEAKESALEIAEFFGANGESLDAITSFLNVINEETDHRMALEVLEKDERWSARIVAAIVVAHFPNKNESWHALADSLIDPAPQVRSVAEQLLNGLLRAEKVVAIDWTNARGTLVALLGGTNAFAFKTILNVLSATDVDSKLAHELVQERPRLLLGFAGAEHDKTRDVAITFLQAISGEDFEQDVRAWKEWIGEKERESED